MLYLLSYIPKASNIPFIQKFSLLSFPVQGSCEMLYKVDGGKDQGLLAISRSLDSWRMTISIAKLKMNL